MNNSCSGIVISKEIIYNENNFKLKLLDFYNKQYLSFHGCVQCADGGILIGNELGYVDSNDFYK